MAERPFRSADFFFSLGLAALLWLLSALAKSYEHTLTMHLSWGSPPEGFVAAKPFPEKASYRIYANGWQLLFETIRPRRLPMDATAFGRRERIATRDFLPVFSQALPRGITLLEIKPDTIQLHLEPLVQRRIPLKWNSKLAMENTCEATGAVQLQPDSVDIFGPATAVEDVVLWPLEGIALEPLCDTARGTVRVLSGADRGIRVVPESVQFLIPVERYTEATLEIPLHDPEEPQLQFIPDRIKVTFQVPLSRYGNIRPGEFAFRTTLQPAAEKRRYWVDLSLEQAPNGVKDISWHPATVEAVRNRHD